MTGWLLSLDGWPAETVIHFSPLLVWDEVLGFVVGKRDVFQAARDCPVQWLADLPFGMELGGRQLVLPKVRLIWPLPAAPSGLVRSGAAGAG